MDGQLTARTPLVALENHVDLPDYSASTYGAAAITSGVTYFEAFSTIVREAIWAGDIAPEFVPRLYLPTIRTTPINNGI